MKIGIYYGGRGVIEDPTLYVLEILEQELAELNVTTERYNIQDHKNEITTLSSTLKEMDGIILAATIEWLGIGGYMSQFLDALWLYGDKEKLSTLYMQPVVMSTTYGEREGMLTLENAWESLGGRPAGGICGYVDDLMSFKASDAYRSYIIKCADEFYRTISKGITVLPKSSQVIRKNVTQSPKIRLTAQESEQLSEIAADEVKVKRQKDDVKRLSEQFLKMLGSSPEVNEDRPPFIEEFENHFHPNPDIAASYLFKITGIDTPLFVDISGNDLDASYSAQDEDEMDLVSTLSQSAMEGIIQGRMTFQRAFSVGDMSVKGSFSTLSKLDEFFIF